MHTSTLVMLSLPLAQVLTPTAALTRSYDAGRPGASTSETRLTAASPMSSGTVNYRAVNHPVCLSPIEFDITPVAPFWLSEVLVYLNSSYPPPQAYGRIRAGSQANPSHLTIFVDQAIFNQLCGALSGSAVDIGIDYTDDLVTNIFAVEP
jgi:hypothetical protein